MGGGDGRKACFPIGFVRVMVTFPNIVKCFKIHKSASLLLLYLVSVTDGKEAGHFRHKET